MMLPFPCMFLAPRLTLCSHDKLYAAKGEGDSRPESTATATPGAFAKLSDSLISAVCS